MKTLLLSTALLAATGPAGLAQDTEEMFRTAAGPDNIHASGPMGMRIYPADVADATAAEPDAARVPVARDGYLMAEEVDLTAERLTGAAAYDTNDEWIGEVSELVLDDEGRVHSVVIDVGGFLGIGEKPVALTLSDVDILVPEDGSDIRVYVSMTESELEAMSDYRG